MAKKFKFRLEPLLRIRQQKEEARKRALAEVLTRLNEQTARAQRYDAMIRQEHHNLRDGFLVGVLDVRHLAHHRRYVNSVMRGMIQALCERAQTQQKSQQVRQDLVEAVKGRKVLENLRQRRRGEWVRRQDHLETVSLDEMGLAANRRRQEP